MATPIEAEPGIRNYPYNCWWVAAFGDEVGRQPLGRWLLDTPVVLYRTEAGEAVALEDRCPHRQAPLSIGRIRGDAIECGYHGFQFGSSGRCIRVPSMSSPPPIRVEAYPVREVGPLVWVYLGDQQRIDEVPPPPDLPWITDPNFTIRTGLIEVVANYLLLKENVLDLTHFGYVHAATFQITDWTDAPQVFRNGDTVAYRQEFARSPLIAGMAVPLGLEPGTPWTRINAGRFLSPAAQEGSTTFHDPDAPDAPMASVHFAHLTTPIDRDHMHYFYVIGRDFARDDAAMDMFADLVKRGFKEDEFVLEQVQAMMNRKPRRGSTGERSVKADAAGIEARRIIERWMARETLEN
jgi:phenylpropionate dioxygenase-like ring-hydroxylating dioxygenase large terminal subunit